ncbi:MAG: FliM/FliN family flagellar motor switch protein, partial [Deltaproteobacteria bacterium]|nr:FliM/FliN family flagellar motor switch protein [Deltaproteobacteria bacterium]
IQQAWLDVYEVKTVFSHSEMDPQFTGIGKPEDVVIVNKFEVELENVSGIITICTPYSSIEPIKDRLKTGFQDEAKEVDKEWRRYIEKKIMDMDMELSCTIGMANIKAEELLGLKVDDVIILDRNPGNNTIVKIEGIPKFKGSPGSCNNRKAVKISERIKEG